MFSFHVKVLIAQLYLTLCDPIDCSPPGSSVYGIFQARILEWVALSFSRVHFMQFRVKSLFTCNVGGSAGKESACNAGDPVQFLGQEDPLENG